MQTRPLVLVTGATGAIGPRVVEALCDAGYQVRALSRIVPAEGLLPDGVDVVAGDIIDAEVVKRSMQGVWAVVHMAALLHIVNLPPDLEDMYEQINVGGTSLLVEEATRAGVERFVFASTIAVYGATGGCVVNEETLPHPNTFYARTKLAAERLVLQIERPDGKPFGTVLRFGAVYGSRVKGNYNRLLKALSKRRFVTIGSGLNRHTLIYDRDAARVILNVLQHSDALGRIFNVSDGQFHTLNDIVGAICEALGTKPPGCHLPVAPVRLATQICENLLKPFLDTPPIGPWVVDKVIEDMAVDSQLIQKALSFAPQYDLKRGWKEAVDELRKRGEPL